MTIKNRATPTTDDHPLGGLVVAGGPAHDPRKARSSSVRKTFYSFAGSRTYRPRPTSICTEAT